MMAMPTYYFDLVLGDVAIPDPVGLNLPDEAAAREHAARRVEELRNVNRWSITIIGVYVRDERRTPLFQVGKPPVRSRG